MGQIGGIPPIDTRIVRLYMRWIVGIPGTVVVIECVVPYPIAARTCIGYVKSPTRIVRACVIAEIVAARRPEIHAIDVIRTIVFENIVAAGRVEIYAVLIVRAIVIGKSVASKAPRSIEVYAGISIVRASVVE